MLLAYAGYVIIISYFMQIKLLLYFISLYWLQALNLDAFVNAASLCFS